MVTFTLRQPRRLQGWNLVFLTIIGFSLFVDFKLHIEVPGDAGSSVEDASFAILDNAAGAVDESVADDDKSKSALLQDFPSDPPVVDSLFEKLKRESSENKCQVDFFSGTNEYLAQAFDNSSFLITETDLLDHPSEEIRDHFFPMPYFDYNYLGKPVKGGVAIFEDAFVEGAFSMVFDCRVVYFPGGCKLADAAKNKFDIRKLTRKGSRLVQLDTVVLITQFWGQNFWHSLAEDLPRLSYVSEFLRTNPHAVILAYDILITKNVAKHIFNPLFGLEESHQWIKFETSKVYHAKRLLVPSATACGRSQPAAVHKLQGLTMHNSDLLPLAAYSDENSTLKTIVLQKRARRGLTNHNELLNAIRNKFSECCRIVEFFGTETFEHAMGLHHSASVLIGPHGAGLAHSIFMKRNTSAMVEIHPKIGNVGGQGVNYCQQRTANVSGVVSRILIMQKSSIPFGNPYPVEDITLVLQTVQEVLDIIEKRQQLR
jgi:hypothetical protein